MSEKSESTMADKVKKIYKPVLGFLCVLVIVLSIAGAAISVYSPATNSEDVLPNHKAQLTKLKTAQDLFICIVIFSVLALLLALFVKFQKSGDQSKYEINEKSDKPAKGLDNVAFDGEKGGKKEKWMDNYVPYGQFPKGNAIEEEVIVENEKDNKTHEKVTDSNKEDEKWKDNYVAYEEEEKTPENE
eukprot:GFUD01041072.1.p1 GENE.GFUD01041072.1~~GFUD01041072.1.p1  ORF type:complete len:187 (-),score=76.86 GFUD01041072.1:80-640(-)